MKLGQMMKKPMLPKTKEQKQQLQDAQKQSQPEQQQQQQINSQPAEVVQNDKEIEQLIEEIERVYGSWFEKDDIKQQLTAQKGNKQAAIKELLHIKETNEKIQEKIAATKFQALQSSSINQPIDQQVAYLNSDIGIMFPPNKKNQIAYPVSIPLSLLKQIEENFKLPRPDNI